MPDCCPGIGPGRKRGHLDVYKRQGYTGELQNFMEAVAFDRVPDSDFTLAYDTIRILYAAYQSAEEGRRVTLETVP